VIFYGDANCKEKPNFALQKDMKVNQLSKYEDAKGDTHDWNDEISSISIGTNMVVELYSDKNYKGEKITLYPGGYTHLEQYNDSASSVKVTKFKGGKLVTLFEKNGNLSTDPKQSVQYLAVGKYNYDGKQNQLLLDNDAATIYIPAGLEVTLWTKWNGGGKSVLLKGGAKGKKVGLANEGVENDIESITVARSEYKLVMAVVSNLRPDPDKTAESMKTGSKTTCSSQSSGSLKCTGALTYSKEQSVGVSSTTGVAATESLTITEGESVGVEGVASASLEVSIGIAVEESHSGTDSKDTTDSTQITIGYEVDAHPHTTLEIQLSATMQPMIGDIKYHYVSTSDPSNTYTTDATVTYDNYANARVVATDGDGNEVPHKAKDREPVGKVEVPMKVDNSTETAYDGAMKMEYDYDTVEGDNYQSAKGGSNHLLDTGHTIKKGLKHYSKGGTHYLVFQEGDLVVYKKDNTFVWSMRDNITHKGHVDKVVYQHDGNLAAYDAKGGYMWSALHKATPKGTELHLTDDGVLQIVQPGEIIAWKSTE
jgi:hypothetical protein